MEKRVRKSIIVLGFLVAGFTIGHAQKWHTDFEQAKIQAQKGNKKIILVFKGSDWNGTCVRLKNEIWTNPEFITYAKKHYVLLEADFPKRKENKLSKEQLDKNNALADQYNRERAIPLVAVLDKNGNLLGTTGYKDVDADQYIELLNFFKG